MNNRFRSKGERLGWAKIGQKDTRPLSERIGQGVRVVVPEKDKKGYLVP